MAIASKISADQFLGSTVEDVDENMAPSIFGLTAAPTEAREPAVKKYASPHKVDRSYIAAAKLLKPPKTVDELEQQIVDQTQRIGLRVQQIQERKSARKHSQGVPADMVAVDAGAAADAAIAPSARAVAVATASTTDPGKPSKWVQKYRQEQDKRDQGKRNAASPAVV